MPFFSFSFYFGFKFFYVAHSLTNQDFEKNKCRQNVGNTKLQVSTACLLNPLNNVLEPEPFYLDGRCTKTMDLMDFVIHIIL